jgi:hypothetical protein
MRGLSAGVVALIAVCAALVGVVVGTQVAQRTELPKAFAVTSLADEGFAVCTTPVDANAEGLFLLDFETGDLSGGVLSPLSSTFAAFYKYNVLNDLGFKPGQAKNPRFLLVAGEADLRRTRVPLAPSVLYVTDSSTGVTAAYGIPWNPQQAANGGPMVGELVLLDVARPRGGGAPAP